MGYRIKPLSWSGPHDGNFKGQFIWSCNNDDYWIVQNSDGDYIACYNLTPEWIPASPVLGSYKTLDEAQQRVWNYHVKYVNTLVETV